MDGAVLSILTWAVCAASSLPALSVLKNVTVWSPSAERVKLVPLCAAPPSTVYVVEAGPDKLSLGVRLTVTLPLVQLFDAPLMPVVGAVLSILTAGLLVALVLL